MNSNDNKKQQQKHVRVKFPLDQREACTVPSTSSGTTGIGTLIGPLNEAEANEKAWF